MRERVVAGDDAALREVYDQYASFVYGLAVRVIGDHRAAEDVSQDVFVSFWERPAAFDPARGSLRTWLGTLTHRRAVDHVRREEARRRRAEREAGRAVAAPDVEEMATALLTAERVRAALEVLPDGTATRGAPRVLRRQDLPAGGRDARHPRGHGEVAAAARAATHRRDARGRRG